jgi:hypothetical protein
VDGLSQIKLMGLILICSAIIVSFGTARRLDVAVNEEKAMDPRGLGSRFLT